MGEPRRCSRFIKGFISWNERRVTARSCEKLRNSLLSRRLPPVITPVRLGKFHGFR